MQGNPAIGLSIPSAFRVVGLVAIAIATSAGLFPAALYALDHPDFSLFTTYLSDIGDSGGWPQVLFNTLTLVGAPVRLLVLVLLAYRLAQLGGSPRWLTAIVGIGGVSMLGTIMMTAVPFSVAPTVHKTGVPLYFFGVVLLQLAIAGQEWRMPRVPRVLPILSIAVVAVFLVFFALFVALEQGLVGRNTPVVWEWGCLFVSILWLAGHVAILGDPTERGLRDAKERRGPTIM